MIADAQLAATVGAGRRRRADRLHEPRRGARQPDLRQISGGEQPGEVTYGEAFAVQPFGNLLVTMDLTGAQIEQLLEQQAIDDRPAAETC